MKYIIAIIIGLLSFVIVHNKIPDNQLKITYKQSAGIPFKWEYEITDKTVVKFVKSYVAKDENTNGKVGAPIYTDYIFEGLSEGETTIIFKNINFTNNIVSKKDIYKIKVDKNKKITIINKE